MTPSDDDNLQQDQTIESSSIENSEVQMAQSESGQISQAQQNAKVINNNYFGSVQRESPLTLGSKKEVQSDLKRQRLEKERDELHANWKLMHEKLTQLQKNLIIEAGVSAKFQLEQEIKVEEANLKLLKDKLEKIEESLSSYTVIPNNLLLDERLKIERQVSKIESLLLEASSIEGIQLISYMGQELLERYPNYPEIKILIDKIQKAIDYENSRHSHARSASRYQHNTEKNSEKPIFSISHPCWLILVLIVGVLVASPIVLLRTLGFLQTSEVNAFDSLMLLRPLNQPDNRIFVVTVDKADRDYQDKQKMGRLTDRSLSDKALSDLLQKLAPHQPAAIGLDIEHNFKFEANLEQTLKKSENFISSCYIGSENTPTESKKSPPNILPERLGFADFVDDDDKILRRQLLLMAAGEDCNTSRSFSLQVAHIYLKKQNVQPIKKRSDERREINGRIIEKLEYNIGGYNLRTDQTTGYQILLNYHYLDPISVPLRDILQGTKDYELSKCAQNCIVLIGVDQPDQDRHLTIYDKGKGLSSKPGVIIHAHMISQILDFALNGRSLIWSLPKWGEILFIFSWSFIGSLIVVGKWRSLRIQGLAILIVFFSIGTCCAVFILFGGWLPLVPSSLAFGAALGISYGHIILSRSKLLPLILRNYND